MSIVIGIKYNKGVLLASDGQVTQSGNRVIDNQNKIFESEHSNTAIGCVGYLRDMNIIEVQEDLLPSKDIVTKATINKIYVIKNFVPSLFDLFRSNKRLRTKDDIEYFNSVFMFCTSDKIFEIDQDGSVIECLQYSTIGCGKELVMGYLDTMNLQDLTFVEAKEILTCAICKACDKDIYINKELNFINLEKGDN